MSILTAFIYSTKLINRFIVWCSLTNAGVFQQLIAPTFLLKGNNTLQQQIIFSKKIKKT